MSDPSSQPTAGRPASGHADPARSGQAGAATSTTVVGQERRTAGRRGLLGGTLGLIVDVVVAGALLVLLNDAHLRDTIFVITSQSTAPHSAPIPYPLLNSAFLGAVLPPLDVAIVFAFLTRLAARVADTSTWPLVLNVLSRLVGAAVLVFMALQPSIFSIPRDVQGFPGNSLENAAELWGHVALYAAAAILVVATLFQIAGIARARQSTAREERQAQAALAQAARRAQGGHGAGGV
jgi:hypothetical protein